MKGNSIIIPISWTRKLRLSKFKQLGQSLIFREPEFTASSEGAESWGPSGQETESLLSVLTKSKFKWKGIEDPLFALPHAAELVFKFDHVE